MDGSKQMGPNRQVQIYWSKKMGSKNWVKLTDLKTFPNSPNSGVLIKTEMSPKLKCPKN